MLVVTDLRFHAWVSAIRWLFGDFVEHQRHKYFKPNVPFNKLLEFFELRLQVLARLAVDRLDQRCLGHLRIL